MTQSKHSAVDVANLILFKCNERWISDVSNKKLQKLLYYTQAWSLTLNKESIFSDKIEAWVHWPAIKSVYNTFKMYNWESITIKIDESIQDQFNSKELSLIDDVIEAYWKFDAGYLEVLTHSEDPWIQARSWLDPDMGTDTEISQASMISYYSSLVA